MKLIIIPLAVLALSGCSVMGNKDYSNYVDSLKSVSKDNTVSQTACFAAVGEIARSADNSAKVSAIALAEKCKNEAIKIVPPKQGILPW